MDTERLKITAETAAIRGRGWGRLVVRLVGIALVIIAGSNLLLGESIWPVVVYRDLWATATGAPAYPVGDFVAIGVGAAVAHFV
jgi:hypothetical protein